MKYLSKTAAIIKIKLLQNSSAKTYFETSERIFLTSVLEKIESSLNNEVEKDLADKIEKLYQKYQKFI